MLSTARQKTCKAFAKAIQGRLKALGPGAGPRSPSRSRPTPLGDDPTAAAPPESGLDRVEIVFAPNPGEDPRPLRKIASGGELSRVTLAVKTVLAGADRVPTLVFDEIDTGVGGRLGAVLGKKLAELAEHHQVICVTHLPQMASFADSSGSSASRSSVAGPGPRSPRSTSRTASTSWPPCSAATRPPRGPAKRRCRCCSKHRPPDDEHAVPFQRPPATVPIQEIVMPVLVDVAEPRRPEIPPLFRSRASGRSSGASGAC